MAPRLIEETERRDDAGAGAGEPPAAARSANGEGPTAAGPRSRSSARRRRDSLYRRMLAVADMLAVGLALGAGAVLLGDDRLTPAAIAVLPCYLLVVKALGLYDRDEHLLRKTTLDEMPALFGLAALATLLLHLAGGVLVEGELDRRQLVATWELLFLLSVAFRAAARGIARRGAPVERCLLVGQQASAAYLREKLAIDSRVKAELVGVITFSAGEGAGAAGGGLGPTLAELAVDRVIFETGPGRTDELMFTARALKAYGVKVSTLPEISRVAGSSVELDHLYGVTLLGVRGFEFTRSSRAVKRSFDLLGASLGLLVVSPILAGVAVAIKLDSRGPVLFRQLRIGAHGEEFEMLKLRSMVAGAEGLKAGLGHLNEGARGLFKIPEDPRLTRIGRWIRRFQIDELPQLFNVLRGEMSLVGPRPLIPEEDRKIEGWYRRRLDVPPGITGHWQVLGSSARVPLTEMVKLDYVYVANWSLWGDILILLRTVPFVFGRRGV